MLKIIIFCVHQGKVSLATKAPVGTDQYREDDLARTDRS